MATTLDDYRKVRDDLLARMKRQMGSDAPIILEAFDKYLDVRDIALWTHVEERLRQLRIGGL